MLECMKHLPRGPNINTIYISLVLRVFLIYSNLVLKLSFSVEAGFGALRHIILQVYAVYALD